jgi:hypothetical protein
VDAGEVGASKQIREEPRELRLLFRRPLRPVASQRGLGHLPPVEHPIEDRRRLPLGCRRGVGLPQELVDLADVGAELLGGLAGQRRRHQAQNEQRGEPEEQRTAHHDSFLT